MTKEHLPGFHSSFLSGELGKKINNFLGVKGNQQTGGNLNGKQSTQYDCILRREEKNSRSLTLVSEEGSNEVALHVRSFYNLFDGDGYTQSRDEVYIERIENVSFNNVYGVLTITGPDPKVPGGQITTTISSGPKKIVTVKYS